MTDFFIVGSAKSGTTILYEWLKSQSAIFLPDVKEPHHYCFGGLSPDSIGIGVDPVYAGQISFTQESYRALYADAAPGQLKGDVSPGYLHFPKAAAAIHDSNPDAKIICILRNPVDRAYSQYMHHRRDGYEPQAHFASALACEQDRIDEGWWWGYHYCAASRYASGLQRYLALFLRTNILFLLYDDLVSDQAVTFEKVMNFLGCTKNYTVDFSKRTNVASSLASVPRLGWLHRRIEAGGPIHRIARALLPAGISSRLRNGLAMFNRQRAYRLAAPLRARLAQSFRDDIAATSRLIDRDLSAWLEL